MTRKASWLIVLLMAALLVAACGPTMTTPTPVDTAAARRQAHGSAGYQST